MILEENAAPHLAAGRLVHVVEEWCVPFGGHKLVSNARRAAAIALATSAGAACATVAQGARV